MHPYVFLKKTFFLALACAITLLESIMYIGRRDEE